MIPYFFLIAIPAILSLTSIDKKPAIEKIALLVTSLIYILFIGLRNEIGMDWPNYMIIYDYISGATIEEAIHRTEPSYALLDWLSARANTDIYGSNFIVAIIFVSGLVKFAEKMPLPWLALTSVTPYLVIAIGMSGVRQAAAIGIIFYLLAGWSKNSFAKNLVLASIAASFHYSAVVIFLFVVQNAKMTSWIKWSLLLLGGTISFIIFTQTEQYTFYEQTYITTDEFSSPGALQHVALNAIPAAIYLIFRQKWNSVYGKNNLMIILSILSLASIVGVFFSSTAVDRLSLYLSPIQLLIYSTIPIVFKSQFYSVLIVMTHLAILYIWLNYANNSSAFVPYKNILF